MNPKPSGYYNKKNPFANKAEGFILNSRGDLIHTKDAGDSWSTVSNFPGTTTMELKDSTGVIVSYTAAIL